VSKERQALVQAAFPGCLVTRDKKGQLWLSGELGQAFSLSAAVPDPTTQEHINTLAQIAQKKGTLPIFARCAVALGFQKPKIKAPSNASFSRGPSGPSAASDSCTSAAATEDK
jgi:hypothetical protein